MRFLPQKTGRPPVRLPADYQEQTLADLPYGAPVFVTPWTMVVDDHAQCWINLNTTYGNTAGGTVSLLIERTPEGWLVRTDTLTFPHQWSPRDIGSVTNCEPVIALDRIEGDDT